MALCCGGPTSSWWIPNFVCFLNNFINVCWWFKKLYSVSIEWVCTCCMCFSQVCYNSMCAHISTNLLFLQILNAWCPPTLVTLQNHGICDWSPMRFLWCICYLCLWDSRDIKGGLVSVGQVLCRKKQHQVGGIAEHLKGANVTTAHEILCHRALRCRI